MAINGALSVDQLNIYVKSLLESDRHLKNIWVRGELVNFTRNAKSGHCYFSLRDRGCSVRSVMFQWQASQLNFQPADGQRVLLLCRVSLYERDGQYQLYVEQMFLDGVGDSYLAFVQLKDRLEKEGLFLQKKALPSFPQQIGVCTSRTGAALRDVISVVRRNAPMVSIRVFPCLMQGDKAAAEVCAGISFFNERYPVDVIIVARGGGAYEDLSVFNDETLARTVAASAIPVISAIGHETDTTILDFAADVRAATPSVAAELAVGQVGSLQLRFRNADRMIRQFCRRDMDGREQHLRLLFRSLRPESYFVLRSLDLDRLTNRVLSSGKQREEMAESVFVGLTARLAALNPLAVLQRGYAVVRMKNRTLDSVDLVQKGDSLEIILKDGVIHSVATEKTKQKL